MKCPEVVDVLIWGYDSGVLAFREAAVDVLVDHADLVEKTPLVRNTWLAAADLIRDIEL